MTTDTFILVKLLRKGVDDYLNANNMSFNDLAKKVNNKKNAKRVYLFFKNKKDVNICLATLLEYYCFINRLNYDDFSLYIKNYLFDKKEKFISLLDNDNQLFLEILQKKELRRTEAYAVLRKLDNNITLYSFIDICKLLEINVLKLLEEYDHVVR